MRTSILSILPIEFPERLQFSGHQYVADKLMCTVHGLTYFNYYKPKTCVRVKNKRRLCFYNVQNLFR